MVPAVVVGFGEVAGVPHVVHGEYGVEYVVLCAVQLVGEGGYFLVARLDKFVVELDVGAGVLVGDDEVDFAAFQCVEHGAYFEFPVVE